MIRLGHALHLTVLALALALLGGAHARQMSRRDLHARQLEAAQRFRDLPHLHNRAARNPGVKNITFTNPRASVSSRLSLRSRKAHGSLDD
jgi:hypothetical protein